MKTSKNEILFAALEIFANCGFEGTKLSDISDKLGITKGALYKHYESKEALWNALVDHTENYYDQNIGFKKIEQLPSSFEELVLLSKKQMRFTMHDPIVKNVRKLLTIEQFKNKRIAALASRHFSEEIEQFYAKVFENLISLKVLPEQDEHLLAFEYAAPITLLIHSFDREPNREAEILAKAEKHFEHFKRFFGAV